MITPFHGPRCEIVIFQNGEVMVSEKMPLSKAAQFCVMKLPLSTKLKSVSGAVDFCESFVIEDEASVSF